MKNDGGPAFSRAANWTPKTAPEDGHDRGEAGMSLRDWFAGQALAGMPDVCESVDVIAEQAYAMADAMLAERAKK